MNLGFAGILLFSMVLLTRSLFSGLPFKLRTRALFVHCSANQESILSEAADGDVNSRDSRDPDEHYMKLALRHAQFAFREKEVPIGAVIVDNETGRVVSAARNSVERSQDASCHAELVAMKRAAATIGNWRLHNCTLYTTLEPCAMCLGAAQGFRVNRVVYGAKDVRLGACGSWVDLVHNKIPVATQTQEREKEEEVKGEHVDCALADKVKVELVDNAHPMHQLSVRGGVLEEECSSIVKRFFRLRRRESKALSKLSKMENTGVSRGGSAGIDEGDREENEESEEDCYSYNEDENENTAQESFQMIQPEKNC